MPPPWFPQQPLPQQGGEQGNSVSNNNQGSGNSAIAGQGNPKSMGKQSKKRQENRSVASDNTNTLMSYAKGVCGICGEPGHERGKCTKTRTCFICNMVTHQEENCPVKKKTHLAARYFGSAAIGLGFYHVNMSDINLQHYGRLKNVGIVFIEDGDISKEDLAKEFSEIYKTNWPWQINALDNWTMLVKFSPEIPVESVAGYPCFGLPKSNVTVNIDVWKGEITATASQQVVWMKIGKINPK
ncbi:hypothetical protein VPH35_077177 [Triticum aestivum]|uniref:CCHC-type domain-containing protein n=1 Tax=Aegilops tauschii subsp. strangulata TaxID=200361 RepID=A0A453HKV1_AEGTS